MKKWTIWLFFSAIILSFVPASAEAASNKAIHWGFKRSENHEPPSAGKELDQLLAKYDAFYLEIQIKKKFI